VKGNPPTNSAKANGKNEEVAPDTGLEAVGKVRWGSHFCIFYETKKDLLDILVPYFRAGLTANEFCLWLVAPYEFSSASLAKKALGENLPDLDRHLDDKRMEIVTYKKCFRPNGTLDTSKAIGRFRKRLDDAERRGLTGLRASGSSAWIREDLGVSKFRDYEREVNARLADRRLIAACTFPLILSGAGQILDAARTHQFAVIVRRGVWKKVEIDDVAAARRQAGRANPKLEQLSFRQREILQHITEGENTKEVAGLLGISIKTVEAHRLQIMQRLKIDNVPGLVRFAIRTGLISAET
jgi:DNA-binding CsgD family transcriptional regulator